MDTTAHKLLARRLLEEVAATGNVDRLTEFYAPDARALHFGLTGIEGFKEHFATFHRCYPDSTISVNGQVAEGDIVVTWWTMRGTHTGQWGGIPPTNRAITLHGVHISVLQKARLLSTGGSTSLEALLDIGVIKWNVPGT